MIEHSPQRGGIGDDDPLVVVAGAGPVGLWLASELRRAGVRVRLLEKRPVRSEWSRALTVHARTLEVLAMRGEVDAFLAAGRALPAGHYAMSRTRIDLSKLPTRYPFALFLPQVHTEELLEAGARRSGVTIETGAEVVDVTQHDDGVEVTVRRGGTTETLAADYVVGCDGRRSAVRSAAGIGYVGTPASITAFGVDAIIDADLLPADPQSSGGVVHTMKVDATHHRIIVHDRSLQHLPVSAPLTVDDARASLTRLIGSDLRMREPRWLTRVGNDTFQAERYRDRRVLLAGDAAHVHFPMGGQGLNLGVQDAMNLGWKLGAVARGVAGESLLDTYHREREPVGAAVVQDTLAQTALVQLEGRAGDALRNYFADTVLASPDVNQHIAGFVSAIDVAYPPSGPAHPLAGRRVPDLDLTDGTTVFNHLADGRFVLLVQDPAAVAEHDLPADHVRVVSASAIGDDTWSATGAVLIRPDGYAAWVTDEWTVTSGDDVRAAFRTWLPPVAAPLTASR